MTIAQLARGKPLARLVPQNTWIRFALRRAARFLVSIFLLVTAAFGMIHAVPGDAVRAALGSTASQAVVDARRHALHLDQPLWWQYLHYLRGVFTGDLGMSQVSGLPVADVIGSRLVATVTLAVLAFVATLVIAIPLGMLAGARTWRGWRPLPELTFSGLTGAFSAVPDFLLGVGLVYVFAITVPVFPVADRTSAASYVLPVAALAIGPAAIMSRIVRAETVRVLDEDYVRTGRAKRLPARRLYLRHVLPNLLTSTLTLSGLLLSGLLAGTVLVENIFAWPGLGTALTQAVLDRDYPLVQGLALLFGGGVLLINLVVDVVLAIVDPRSALRQG